MTCEQFRAFLDERPEMRTRAEIGAIFRHQETCPSCRALVDDGVREADALLTPEEVARETKLANEWIDSVLQDPEAL